MVLILPEIYITVSFFEDFIIGFLYTKYLVARN